MLFIIGPFELDIVFILLHELYLCLIGEESVIDELWQLVSLRFKQICSVESSQLKSELQVVGVEQSNPHLSLTSL